MPNLRNLMMGTTEDKDYTINLVGSNTSGQLGRGTTSTNETSFMEVSNVGKWQSISVGERHSMCILNGMLYACGENSDGQLGLGDNSDRDVFVLVPGFTDWDKVECGRYHTIARRTGGETYTTGNNTEGQLGLGDNNDRDVFTDIGINTLDIAAGSRHSIILRVDSFRPILSTGYGNYGQLNDNSTSNSNQFTGRDNVENPISVHAGRNTSFYLDVTGVIYGCGDNSNGQLGVGSAIASRLTYTEVTSVLDVSKIAAGYKHTMVIRNDGQLWATGSNSDEQKGDSSLGNSTSFERVGSFSDWTEVTAGYECSLAIRLGALYVTGDNFRGQLGTGDTTDYGDFTQVLASTGWANVATTYGSTGTYMHTIATKENI